MLRFKARFPGRSLIACVGVGMAGSLGVYAMLATGVIVINTTASLPKGLYIRSADGPLITFCPTEPFGSLSVKRGYRAAGRCPDGGSPLLKPVVAKAGDVVDIGPYGVSVDGKTLWNSAALTTDSGGRDMPVIEYGDYPVTSGEVWVVSSYDWRSFDSRYFGGVQEKDIKGHYKPLWPF